MDRYEKMWNELKDKADKRRKEYEVGNMMSMSESVWGSSIYRDIVELMEDMERESDGS